MTDNPLAQLSKEEQEALAEIAKGRVDGSISRRDALQAAGVLGIGSLIGGGAGVAATGSAKAAPQGNVGTSSDPIANGHFQSLETGEIHNSGSSVNVSDPLSAEEMRTTGDVVRAMGANGNWEQDYPISDHADIGDAINTAISESASQGLHIRIPVGVHSVSTQIDLTHNKSIAIGGGGRRATILRQTLDVPMFIADDGYSGGSSVRSLNLYGFEIQGGWGGTGKGIHLLNAHGWKLSDINIDGLDNDAIWTEGSWYGLIENCRIVYNNGYGIVLSSDLDLGKHSNRVVIRGGRSSRNTRGLLQEGVNSTSCFGVTFERNDYEAIEQYHGMGLLCAGSYFEANQQEAANASPQCLLGQTNADYPSRSEGVSFIGCNIDSGGAAANVSYDLEFDEVDNFFVMANRTHNTKDGVVNTTGNTGYGFSRSDSRDIELGRTRFRGDGGDLDFSGNRLTVLNGQIDARDGIDLRDNWLDGVRATTDGPSDPDNPAIWFRFTDSDGDSYYVPGHQ